MATTIVPALIQPQQCFFNTDLPPFWGLHVGPSTRRTFSWRPVCPFVYWAPASGLISPGPCAESTSRTCASVPSFSLSHSEGLRALMQNFNKDKDGHLLLLWKNNVKPCWAARKTPRYYCKPIFICNNFILRLTGEKLTCCNLFSGLRYRLSKK